MSQCKHFTLLRFVKKLIGGFNNKTVGILPYLDYLMEVKLYPNIFILSVQKKREKLARFVTKYFIDITDLGKF
jgi:hypothetical protein